VSFYDSSGQQDYGFTKPYSDKTAEIIDEEVKKLIDRAYERTLSLLSINRDKLDALAKLLMEREVIFKEDLENIFGKRPFDKEEDLNQIANTAAGPSNTNGVSETTTSVATSETEINLPANNS
jgi:cell division protease FtsH